jgi:hypothetical protein
MRPGGFSPSYAAKPLTSRLHSVANFSLGIRPSVSREHSEFSRLRKNISSLRLCLVSTVPRGSNSNKVLTCPTTVSEILIRPGAPFDSMSAAVFTASPQISKVNFRRPTTPDMTGPVWRTHAQVERRQPHLLALRLHAGRDSLNLQRSKASIDCMPATGSGHASNRHVCVAYRLELLEPVPGYNLVKSSEILVKQPNQRNRLGD